MKFDFRESRMICACFIGILFFALFQHHLWGTLFVNYSNCAFDTSCSNGGGITSAEQSYSIDALISESSSYFLKSNSEIQFFLSQIEASELNGIDFPALNQAIDNAIFDMEHVRAIYVTMINNVLSAPYNETYIHGLRTFNYGELEHEKHFSSQIFGEVRSYLLNGDVRGFYSEVKVKVECILSELYTVKQAVYSGVLPPTSDLWQMNQSVSETLLFGQYAAQVFYSVR